MFCLYIKYYIIKSGSISIFYVNLIEELNKILEKQPNYGQLLTRSMNIDGIVDMNNDGNVDIQY